MEDEPQKTTGSLVEALRALDVRKKVGGDERCVLCGVQAGDERCGIQAGDERCVLCGVQAGDLYLCDLEKEYESKTELLEQGLQFLRNLQVPNSHSQNIPTPDPVSLLYLQAHLYRTGALAADPCNAVAWKIW